MMRSIFAFGASFVISALIARAPEAKAWTRTFPASSPVAGRICTYGYLSSTHYHVCPYVNDSSGYRALSTTSLWVDLTRSGSLNVTASACRQSYTGSAAVCGNAASSGSGSGYVEIVVSNGFKSLGAGASDWDYYYLQLSHTGGGGAGNPNITVFGFGAEG